MAGFNPTYLIDGPAALGPALALGPDALTFVPLTITFASGDTYLTNGMAVTLPAEIDERRLVDIILTKAHDGTRRWEWDGSRSAPMILAYDAHATEEGNGADIAGIVLRAILVLK